MIRIPLSNTKKECALIDDEDIVKIQGYTWRKDKYGYATTVKRVNGRCKTIFMHRIIIGTGIGYDTDHRDHDTLDNRKSNLREATRSQNNLNSKVRTDNTSGYKGVNFHKATNKWRAYVNYNGKQIYLGLFSDIKEAIKARDMRAKELYGEFINV